MSHFKRYDYEIIKKKVLALVLFIKEGKKNT